MRLLHALEVLGVTFVDILKLIGAIALHIITGIITVILVLLFGREKTKLIYKIKE